MIQKLNEQELRKGVEKRLGSPIPEEEWEWLKKNRYVNDALEEYKNYGLTQAVELLFTDIKRLRSYPSGQGLKARKKERELVSKLEVYTDFYSKTYHDLALTFVRKDQDIEEFRQRILRNKLLSPEEVLPWAVDLLLRDVHCFENYPLKELSFWTTREQWREELRRLKTKLPGNRKGSGEARLLGFTQGGQVAISLPFPSPGEYSRSLAWLKYIAERYKDFWFEADIVQFVLTGQEPPGLRYYKGGVFFPGFGIPYVYLRIPWYFPPQRVAKIFRELQRFVIRNKYLKEPSEKYYKLASFTFALMMESTWTWRGLMEKWNISFPEWRYESVRNFHRDVQRVLKQVGIDTSHLPPFLNKSTTARKSNAQMFKDLLKDFQIAVERGKKYKKKIREVSGGGSYETSGK